MCQDYRITCMKCKAEVTHICNEDFKERLIRLMSWVPEGFWSSTEMREAFIEESKRQGDDYDFETFPFFGSQAWTYLIFHKEDARTLHALLDNVMRAAGIDPHEIEEAARKKAERR